MIGTEEFAKPLKEFEIVLEATLDQSLDRYLLAHGLLLEAGLQELKVVYEFMFLIATELDALKSNGIRKQHVH